jgi:hypothetical protein
MTTVLLLLKSEVKGCSANGRFGVHITVQLSAEGLQTCHTGALGLQVHLQDGVHEAQVACVDEAARRKVLHGGRCGW